jgi:hypothetical protein
MHLVRWSLVVYLLLGLPLAPLALQSQQVQEVQELGLPSLLQELQLVRPLELALDLELELRRLSQLLGLEPVQGLLSELSLW